MMVVAVVVVVVVVVSTSRSQTIVWRRANGGKHNTEAEPFPGGGKVRGGRERKLRQGFSLTSPSQPER